MLDSRKKSPKEEKILGRLIWSIVFGIIWLLGTTLFVVAFWYENTFSMEFTELLYTLLAPLEGTGAGTISQILSACLPPVITLFIVYIGFVIALWRPERLFRILRRVGALLCIIGLLASTVYALFAFRITRYWEMSRGHTLIYEDYYVDPATVQITSPDGKPKNLLYIYLESMETTYASREEGGSQGYNYIPNLTSLAKEHISFSDSDRLGGFHSLAGMSWTMGALMSSTSGVPFSLSVFGEKSHNSIGKDGNFANRMTALGDILEEKGYVQEFLCGSKASFGGRESYFKQHGNYKIFDLNTAAEKGYVADGYHNGWWGIDDTQLYEIAKDELRALASEDRPFNFTMLTVDTHHVGGYKCESCGDEYDTNLENVIACSDRQLAAFLEWCEQQPFYEDTLIVVAGDHQRMDSQLVRYTEAGDRTIYNCFINSAVTTKNVKNRTFTSLDMFPTVLAAMGFEIEGDRLGLGVNLFSSRSTLAEQHGCDWLESEINKFSLFYKLNFS